MKLMNIASGSSGNVTFVGTENTSVLIDAGISMKKIEEGMNSIGMSARDLDAIMITHEHSDHIKGLGVLSRKYGIPIYATQGTIKGISENGVKRSMVVPIPVSHCGCWALHV